VRHAILVTVLMLLIVAYPLVQHADAADEHGIPFSSAGFASLSGKNLCDLQGEFYEKIGVYLDGKKEQAVKYLERDGTRAVFLLGRPLTDNCGIVEAVLDVTTLMREGETAEFKCYTEREGGTTWAKWGHVIGLANNQKGRKRFVTARLAWRVDVKQKRFEQLRVRRVTCDTTGYTD
jgi:hypothetical protein